MFAEKIYKSTSAIKAKIAFWGVVGSIWDFCFGNRNHKNATAFPVVC